jgi:hypothetical protein
MRVLTTWMYFDRSQVNTDSTFRRPRGRDEDADLGIGVAWFGGDTPRLGDIDNLKAFRRVPGLQREQSLTEEFLRQYLDLFLMDAGEHEVYRSELPLKNPNTVDYILTQPIVIERSPPVHVTLKGMINATNLPVWIGSYVGWNVVPEHSILLLVTVPGGIIIVSSAAGLASALSAGLSSSVKRLFRKK